MQSDSAGFSPKELCSERAELLRDSILDSLQLPPINDREEQIVKTSGETCEWIFESDQHGFTEWLSNDDPLFWISGSPGSGKSTLMRHVHQKLRVRTRSGPPITIAAFFCWESGVILQRSQVGMLRSLLHQLLKKQPQLVPYTFSSTWSKIWESTTAERVRLLSTWSLEDLTQAFTRFFEGRGRGRTLLLIDGLDELEGDLDGILGLLERIQASGRVKLCVSSRPWDVFRHAFRSSRAIHLQNVNKGDMERFVRAGIPLLSDTWVEALVRKADGVFLWISLAVDNLSSSPASDLSKRIQDLPEGLDSLYHHIILDHSPMPQVMSNVFQLMRSRQNVAAFTRDNDTSVMILRELVLAMAACDIAEIQEMEVEQADLDNVERDCQKTAEEVRRATAGLVVIQSSPNSPLCHRSVTYLHRTVKDWLAKETIWALVLHLSPTYHPDLQHVQAVILSFLHPLEKPRRTRTVSAWWPYITLAMTHARYISAEKSSEAFDLLETLNSVLTWYYPRRGTDVSVDDWARTCFGSLEERGRKSYEEPFLALAVKFGLTDFVSSFLATRGYEEGDGISLLIRSTAYLVNRQQSIFPLSNPIIIDHLLKHGLNPNRREMTGRDGKPRIGKTPWETTLEAVQQAARLGWIEKDDIPRWGRILEVFLQNGADPNVMVCATRKDVKESGRDLLARLGGIYDSPLLKDISRRFVK